MRALYVILEPGELRMPKAFATALARSDR